MINQSYWLQFPKKFEEKNTKLPQLGKQMIRVAIEYSGICGTDILRYKLSAEKKFPPVLLGHEWVGVVIDVGCETNKIKIGDRVIGDVFEQCEFCNNCNYYLLGITNLCSKSIPMGSQDRGAFANYLDISEDMLHVLPTDVSSIDAIFLEPLAVVINALRRFDKFLPNNAKIAIMGAGTIGLLTLMALKNTIQAEITCIDRSELRLSTSKAMGADYAVLSEQMITTNLREKFDVVIDAAGYEPKKTEELAFIQSLYIIKKDGIVLLIGRYPDNFTISLNQIAGRQILLETVKGSGHRNMEDAIQNRDWIKGLSKKMISHNFPLSQIQEAFEIAQNPYISKKVVLSPNKKKEKEE